MFPLSIAVHSAPGDRDGEAVKRDSVDSLADKPPVAPGVGFKSVATTFNAGPKQVNFNEFARVYDASKNNG